MADLSITAANVAHAAVGLQTSTKQAGEALTQGEPVYVSDGKYFKADADASAGTAEVVGIAMTAASTDGYFTMASSGPINLGATLTVGETYVLSATAGGIAPIGDLETGDYVTTLGIATTASRLDLSINASGVQKA